MVKSEGEIKRTDNRPIRSIGKTPEDIVATLQGLPEKRGLFNQLAAHGEPLSPLAGEDEAQSRLDVLGGTPGRRWRRCQQILNERLAAVADGKRTVAMHGSPGAEGVRQIQDLGVGGTLEIVSKARRQ